MFLRAERRTRFLVVFALVLIVPVVPFLVTGPLMPGMRDYATRWVFNSPAYDALFFAIDRLAVAQHLKSAFTAIKDQLHLEPIAHFVYFHLYAGFLTRAALACLAVLLIARWRRDPVASIAALLLCSPAIHPWYWLVIMPLSLRTMDHRTKTLRFAQGDTPGSSALHRRHAATLREVTSGRVAIALQLCAPFSYLLYAGSPRLLVYALCYLPPLACYVSGRLRPSATAS
jgi:hypothetical protein